MVRGEPGVGKSALLDYLAGRASGCRVVRAAGVESEMELAFAGLHQLLAPALDRIDRLPGPQREALRTAFGLSAGPVPDRFLVGLAVLGLVSEVAGERPLICVVDDEQWLDRASVQALGFAARRLAADPVGLVFAARVTGAELAGLPELAVEGLGEEDARALLDVGADRAGGCAGPGPDRGRDAGEPAGAAGVAAGAGNGGAGGRVRVAWSGVVAGPDRGQLPAAARGSAGGDPAAADAGGGRSVG